MKLSPRTSQKLQLKTTVLYAGVGLMLTSIIGVICFIYLNLGKSDDALAATTYNSLASGSWELDATWSGTRPELSLTNKDEVIINTGHEVVVETNLFFEQNTTLRITGILVVKGNLVMEQGTNLIVSTGGVLIVMGDYTAGHHLEFNNQGNIVLLGQIATEHQSTITNSGNIYADESFAITSGNAQEPESNIQNNEQLYTLLQSHGYTPSTLPVTLLSFIVEDATDQVNVFWSTANEKDNDFFSIERSHDGKEFEVIGKVNGNGNSLEVLKYSYTDYNPVSGRSYYRLKQTDYDGEFEYFEIATVNRKSTVEEFKIISVGPNPFADQFSINFYAESDGTVEMHLINTKGEQVATERFEASAGYNQYQFTEGHKLPKDIYFLRAMQNSKATKSLRLI